MTVGVTSGLGTGSTGESQATETKATSGGSSSSSLAAALNSAPSAMTMGKSMLLKALGVASGSQAGAASVASSGPEDRSGDGATTSGGVRVESERGVESQTQHGFISGAWFKASRQTSTTSGRSVRPGSSAREGRPAETISASRSGSFGSGSVTGVRAPLWGGEGSRLGPAGVATWLALGVAPRLVPGVSRREEFSWSKAALPAGVTSPRDKPARKISRPEAGSRAHSAHSCDTRSSSVRSWRPAAEAFLVSRARVPPRLGSSPPKSFASRDFLGGLSSGSLRACRDEPGDARGLRRPPDAPAAPVARDTEPPRGPSRPERDGAGGVGEAGVTEADLAGEGSGSSSPLDAPDSRMVSSRGGWLWWQREARKPAPCRRALEAALAFMGTAARGRHRPV